MRTPRTMLSWQLKLPLLLVLFSTAPLIVITWWMLGLLEETYQASTLESLQAIAHSKAEAIEQFTEDRASDVERIAQLVSENVTQVRESGAVQEQAASDEPLPVLRDAEALPVEPPKGGTPPGGETAPDAGVGPSPEGVRAPAPPAERPAPSARPKGKLEEAVTGLRQQLNLILWDQQKFEELLVISADGRVLVSTYSEHEGRTAAGLDYFEHGRGATYVQPVFMSPITERLTMVIATPIRSQDAEIVGVLAARLNLRGFFRLIDDGAVLGKSGETTVGKQIDSEIVFMAPTRHDPDAAMKRSVPLGSPQGLAMQRAVRGEAGAGRVVDYRGHCVYSAWEHVQSLEWALSVKIDCEEAVAPFDRTRSRTVPLVLGIMLLALASALIAARTLVQPLRELKNAADRISKGDFDVQLFARSGDEIGDLAESFERMIAAIKFFREHSRKEEDEDEGVAVGEEAADPGREGRGGDA